MQPVHFIGDELEIRRVLQGQEAIEEFEDFGSPYLATVAAAGSGLIGGLVLEPGCPQFVEAGAAYVQPGCGAGGVENAAVEVAQDASDELGRQAVDELFLFIRQPLTAGDPLAIPRSWGRCPQTPGVCRIGPMGHGMNRFMP
jgi:hypothetical protein